MAIYAHPDDAEIAAGGTLARLAREGWRVHLVIVTDGSKGSDRRELGGEALARVRWEEQAEAARVLGLAGWRSLGFTDGEVEDTPELRREIVRAVREVRPELVLCPDPRVWFIGSYINHRDHRMVGQACLDAIAIPAGNPHFFCEELSHLEPHEVDEVWLSPALDPDHRVDIGETIETKMEALSKHASQGMESGAGFREMVKAWARTQGREAGVAYAEAFRRLVRRRRLPL